jgi:hypothetical protein
MKRLVHYIFGLVFSPGDCWHCLAMGKRMKALVRGDRMYALIDISSQMLEDSAFDMEGEIRL